MVRPAAATLAEFSNLAIRKAGIPIKDIRATIDA